MKRIAVFCDGTWNRADAEFATNVVKLSQAMAFIAENGVFQQLIYVQGVGTGRGTGWVSRQWDKIAGGALGFGLTANIEEAYRGLVFSHEPGDEIYIFGFSRGAYTARSLAGLLRSSGIPPRSRIAKVPKAIARYRSRKAGTKPDDTASFDFRLGINADLVTSEPEAKWRRNQGHPEGVMLNIAYLGVWDTVGALGLPGHWGLAAKLFNQRYRFHDAALSRWVGSARHAVAIDERRRTFPPTLWDNLDKLNGEQTGVQRHYLQEWFPGNHGSVGGGGDIVGLSDDALIWIGEGAALAGLELDRQVMDWHRGQRDPFMPLVNRTKPEGLFGKIAGLVKKDRDGPDRIEDLAPATLTRWREAAPPYRPKTLAKVAAEL